MNTITIEELVELVLQDDMSAAPSPPSGYWFAERRSSEQAFSVENEFTLLDEMPASSDEAIFAWLGRMAAGATELEPRLPSPPLAAAEPVAVPASATAASLLPRPLLVPALLVDERHPDKPDLGEVLIKVEDGPDWSSTGGVLTMRCSLGSPLPPQRKAVLQVKFQNAVLGQVPLSRSSLQAVKLPVPEALRPLLPPASVTVPTLPGWVALPISLVSFQVLLS